MVKTQNQDHDRIVLGIESSCDETAAAVVVRRADGSGDILSDIVRSQHDAHAAYGGVVPEIAARAHASHIDGVIAQAMTDAAVSWRDLDGVAATAGPGLIGGVIVGLMTAKAIALAASVPLIGVNHLEGHALTARLSDGVAFPYLLLLVSGGHTQLLCVEGVGRYRLFGTTIDDALDEAFDKTAKILGLGIPGGPRVERAARGGDDNRFDLPRPLVGREGCDFSFSGLKTALRRAAVAGEPLSERDVADLCASFQHAAADCVVDRTRAAMARFGAAFPDIGAPCLVVAGGVAANETLKARLAALAAETGFALVAPPAGLCTDNGVMIAWAGLERLALGLTDPLDIAPRARWPLDPAPGVAAAAGATS